MKIVPYRVSYAPKLSQIIIRNLLEINIRDYSRKEMEHTAESFGIPQVMEMAAWRKIFVALEEREPVGILTVVPSWGYREGYYHFLTIFVQPEFHGRGIGRRLIEAGEEYVRQRGGRKITIPSSLTAHGFYHKMGYSYAQSAPNQEGHYVMEKYLYQEQQPKENMREEK